MPGRFEDLLRGGRIIAAVRSADMLKRAVESQASAVFILGGELIEIGRMVDVARSARKPVFVHVDLIEGLAGDQAGIRFLARKIGPDGIITTRHHLVGVARKERLLTVQRLFIVDSQALATGVGAVNAGRPDAVEVMPGIIPRIIAEACVRLDVPIIAGGLIRSAAEVDEALKAGACAASLSREELWGYRSQA